MENKNKPLTQRQQQILSYIDKYTEENGYTPTVREIAEHLQMKSPSSVHYQLNILEKAGYIKRSTNKDRSIRMKDTAPGLPVYTSLIIDPDTKILKPISNPNNHLPFVPRDKSTFIALQCMFPEIATAEQEDICIFRLLCKNSEDKYNEDFSKYVKMGSYVLVSFNGKVYMRKFTISKAHVWYVKDTTCLDYIPIIDEKGNKYIDDGTGDIDGLDAEVEGVLCYVVKDFTV